MRTKGSNNKDSCQDICAISSFSIPKNECGKLPNVGVAESACCFCFHTDT